MSTRERILDATMDLFGQHGFKATSIVQIEKAAGLAEGSGGIYHHFRNKQALLEAGIERHLGRLDALREIQQTLTGLADLKSELTVLGRYTLAVLDSETALLRIVLTESRTQPELVDSAADQLINATYTSFAAWLQHRAGLTADRAEAIAIVGFGSLISSRLLRLLLGRDPVPIDDNVLVATWVHMVLAQITT